MRKFKVSETNKMIRKIKNRRLTRFQNVMFKDRINWRRGTSVFTGWFGGDDFGKESTNLNFLEYLNVRVKNSD